MYELCKTYNMIFSKCYQDEAASCNRLRLEIMNGLDVCNCSYERLYCIIMYGRHNVALGNLYKSNRKAMNRNWSNQKSNPALKTKEGNK